MNAVNPFQPPRAEVSDVLPRGQGFAEPKVWSAKGRIGRLRYLAYLMGAYLVFLLASAVLTGIGAASGTSAESAGGLMMALTGLMMLGMIPFVILSFMTAIQRCHDLGWSGWVVLLSFVPLVNIFVMLAWVFKAGDAGANKFGLPPTPNPRSVKWLALTLPVIALIGILAAVAIPQYAQYQQRSQSINVAPPVGNTP